MAQRLDALTGPLKGVEYRSSPLGEGRGRDPDPRLRFDAFDCTTFVETSLALLECDDDSLARVLDRVRYKDARVGFQYRRHLIGSQWTPDLVRSGRLEDVTSKFFPEAASIVTFDLTRPRWDSRRVAPALKLTPEAIPFGTHEIPFVPVEQILAQPHRVPAGTLVHVIRVDWFGAPDLVSHQGWAMQRNGRPVVRHASTVARKVIDEAWHRFFERLMKPRGWPVAGVQLLRVKQKAPEMNTSSLTSTTTQRASVLQSWMLRPMVFGIASTKVLPNLGVRGSPEASQVSSDLNRPSVRPE